MVTKKELESALGIAVNENKMLNRVLELVCEELHCVTESCPSNDDWNMRYGHTREYCEMGCNDNKEGECYLEYFINKAKAEVGNEED